MKWMGEQLFDGRANAREIGETSLNHQGMCEFSICVVVTSETLFCTLDGSR
jgi:hypothetical protein